MIDPQLRETIDRMVRERITDIIGLVRMSSVEISRTSTGKPGFGVKVYNADPIVAVNKAREIEQRLAQEYGFISEATQGDLFNRQAATTPHQAQNTPHAPTQRPEPEGQSDEPPSDDIWGDN